MPGATAVTRAAEEDVVPPVTAVVPDHEGFTGWAHRDRGREGVCLQVILQVIDTRGQVLPSGLTASATKLLELTVTP